MGPDDPRAVWAAMRCAAIEPPSRCCGSDGVTVLMKRLREAPTRSGSPNERSSSAAPAPIMLCSGVLPKPMPGSSTMLSGEMPALAAISSERAKKSAMSFMMSMAGSALSRLCMMMTGTSRAATSAGHAGIALQAPDVVGDNSALHRAPRQRRPISCCRSTRERRARRPRPAPAAAAATLPPPRPAARAIGPGRFRADVDDVGALGDHPAGLRQCAFRRGELPAVGE